MSMKRTEESHLTDDVDNLLETIDMQQLTYHDTTASERLARIRIEWPLFDELAKETKLPKRAGEDT